MRVLLGRYLFDFERPERYTARRIRHRFDRTLLLEYLAALGIPADSDASYGPARLPQRRRDYPGREISLEEARSLFA
ncbi:hypothetical protein GCM10027449_01200 [Sinomonas notoginsengisoli]|uniref:hypothetical protein n=1 Tax=Sinomonas notoginsengisoli TaxID=1457311 RepID=UPI001F173D9D|nr:hypothetical protein [Sinomonas notoginsengisoli]